MVESGSLQFSNSRNVRICNNGNIRSIDGIVEVFSNFAKYSGLKISMEKSTVYIAGVSAASSQLIENQFSFEVGSLPVRYLGLPLVTKRFTSADYLPLLEQIKKRIGSWTTRFLSYAGRLNLISSVLWSICNFWLAAFRLPRACIDEINKLCSAFLWSGADLNSRKAKVSWENVCKPKQEGGLGLRSLKEANDVCCLKLIWRILSHGNSLWVKWIEETLLKTSFWSIKVNTSVRSWIWKKLLKYRDMAYSLCKMEVKNGESTYFWYDNWSDLGKLADIGGDRGVIDLDISKKMTVAEAWARRRRRHRVDSLNQIEDVLMEKLRSRRDEKDTVVWKGRGNVFRACFSTKDTWNHIRTTSNTVTWHKGVWFANATPKLSFCTWLAVQDWLSTGIRMIQWNGGQSADCVLCHNTIETRDHLFFTCPYTSPIWEASAKNLLRGSYTTDWSTIIDHVSTNRQPHIEQFLTRYALQASVHTIWRERNGRRHGEDPNPGPRLVRWIDRLVRNRLSSLRLSGDRRHDNGLQVWFNTRYLAP